MARKERRKLTPDEVKKLKTMVAIRLPMAKIAAILDISATQLSEMLKKDAALRREVEYSKDMASAKVFESAYDMAISKKSPQMTIFWLKTQEGVREVERLELTGKDGGPIELKDKSREELEAMIARRRALMQTLAEEENEE